MPIPATDRIAAETTHVSRRWTLVAVTGVVVVLVAALLVWRGIPQERVAVLAQAPRTFAVTAEPRPLSEPRWASGVVLFQTKGGPTQLCVGDLILEPFRCAAAVGVAGVSAEEITWLETHGTTAISYVDLVGTFSSPTLPATFAVEQIGAVGTLMATSGYPSPTSITTPVPCTRASDLGGEPTMPGEADQVPGFQAVWSDGLRFFVASTADAATVEAQIRQIGYLGKLCVVRLDGPSNAELLAAVKDLVSTDGLVTARISTNGFRHVQVRVMVAVPGNVAALRTAMDARTAGVPVAVVPQFLTVV